MSQHAQAIVFDAPQQLSVQTLEVKAFEANDIEVDVTFSGISTGTERLLWDGCTDCSPSSPPVNGAWRKKKYSICARASVIIEK